MAEVITLSNYSSGDHYQNMKTDGQGPPLSSVEHGGPPLNLSLLSSLWVMSHVIKIN